MWISICGQTSLTTEHDLKLRLEDAFVRPVFGHGRGSGATVEVGVRIVELPLDVGIEIPVDAQRKLSRGLRGHVRTGESELELPGVGCDVADPGRHFPRAPSPVSRVERAIWLDPTVGRIFTRERVRRLRHI